MGLRSHSFPKLMAKIILITVCRVRVLYMISLGLQSADSIIQKQCEIYYLNKGN